MTYKHLSIEERAVIAFLIRNGESVRSAAKAIGRDPSTVSREIRRNPPCEGAFGLQYYAWKAGKMAAMRASEARKGPKLPRELILKVATYLAKSWSPEQIRGRLGAEAPSVATIYRWVASGVISGGAKKLLRRKGDRGVYETRGKFNKGKSIRKRDKSVYKRLEFGHWEADTVVSGAGKSAYCFVTLAERKTRMYFAIKVPNRKAAVVTGAIVGCLSKLPEGSVKTITCDNGKEFSCWKEIEEALGCQVYFADPFCAWQKGTNENTNGLIRQWFPKGSNLRRWTQAYIDGKLLLLNNRPRKCLNWRTPTEMFSSELDQLLH